MWPAFCIYQMSGSWQNLRLRFGATIFVATFEHPAPAISLRDLRLHPKTLHMPLNTTPHLLVVEDHPVFRRFLLSWLSRYYEVTVLPSGIQALRWLQAGNHTDAVLLDLEMAGISGWQVAQNLRASGLFHEMPIVAMTSTVDDGVRQRCTALDITHVFAKPYNPQALLGALAEATGAAVASRSAQAA